MKLLFVYESLKIIEDNKGNFYSGWSQEVWNKYYNISNAISLICRKEPEIYDIEVAEGQFELLNKNKINFIEIPNLHSSIKVYLSLKQRKNIYKILERAVQSCSGVIVRLPNEISVMTIKLAKKYNKPFLVEVVGCAWDSLWNHSYRGKVIAIINYLSMKKAIEGAPYALYVTGEFLQKRYPCTGKSVGISDVALPTLDESILRKRILKINNQKKHQPKIIGTIAAVNVKYKGQEYIIKAISKLNREGYNFEYHLAGGGDIRFLKSLAENYGVSDKVKFLGTLSHEKVFNYLDNIDIYIQPSKIEGLPRALVEAMSRACPTLGSNTGGIPELVNKNFLFPFGSINEICNLLKVLDKKNMLAEAYRSFEKAKYFDKKLLEEQRKILYKDFKEMCGD